jgi:glycosyltransferase involved in cell wall biosynthesis
MNAPKNANTVFGSCSSGFPAISESVRGVKLYVVGGDPSPDVIRLSSPSIVVTGFVDSVRPYLAKCGVFIVPMTEGTGIKSKVLEAMAMSKPVVTTPLGILGIDARNGEEVAVADGSAEFADMVNKLLRDTGMRSRMGNNARKPIEREYSWEHAAAAICRCYEELIRKASS